MASSSLRIRRKRRWNANLEYFGQRSREHLKEHKLDFGKIPYVLQLNKRDLPGVLAIEDLAKHSPGQGEPIHGSRRRNRPGVFETLPEVPSWSSPS